MFQQQQLSSQLFNWKHFEAFSGCLSEFPSGISILYLFRRQNTTELLSVLGQVPKQLISVIQIKHCLVCTSSMLSIRANLHKIKLLSHQDRSTQHKSLLLTNCSILCFQLAVLQALSNKKQKYFFAYKKAFLWLNIVADDFEWKRAFTETFNYFFQSLERLFSFILVYYKTASS